MQQVPEPAPVLPAPSTRELVHTLNNQLTVVLAHAECAKDSDDPEELRRALRAIVQAATAMAESVRAISRSAPRPTLDSARRIDHTPT